MVSDEFEAKKTMMSIYQMKVSDLKPLNQSSIVENLQTFLCDDSDIPTSATDVIMNGFSPDSFTIYDRYFSPSYLSPDEQCEKTFIKNLIKSKINLAERNNFIKFDQPQSAIIFFYNQVKFFINQPIDGTIIGNKIYNQEFPDIVDRLMAFCIFGSADYDMLLHKGFNNLSLPLIDYLLENQFKEIRSLKYLLKLSIASGLIGLDLKGSQCCASKYSTPGISLSQLTQSNIKAIAAEVYTMLSKVCQSDLAIDYWDMLVDSITKTQGFKLIW